VRLADGNCFAVVSAQKQFLVFGLHGGMNGQKNVALACTPENVFEEG